MNLSTLYLAENNCYKSGKRHEVKGIMVHSTGANNPQLSRYLEPDDGIIGKNKNGNHWNVAKPGGLNVCVHAFIGKDKNGKIRTYQTLPWDIVGWHSGSGSLGNSKNANNTGYIGFEICEDDLTKPDYFSSVYKEATELCAYLCNKFSLDPYKNIICNSEGHTLGMASNHADIMHWFPRFGKRMNSFRNDVDAILTANTAVNTKPQVSDPWAIATQHKKIIQDKVGFSHPEDVFKLLDEHKFANELYLK